MTGTIHSIHERGYGFVNPSGVLDKNSRHFFHAKHVSGGAFNTLRPGDRVEFESTTTDRGLAAVDVRLVGAAV